MFSPTELSLYELHRKPHEMVTDSTVVAVSPRALRSELMCPICLDLMTNPLTTKEVSPQSASLCKKLSWKILCSYCRGQHNNHAVS